MRILKARAALLSDYEVLQLLREGEDEQKNEARMRKEQNLPELEVSPNLRTMQFEAISSLSQPFRTCARQNAGQIRAFLDDLAARGYVIPDERILAGEPGLTKTERLQLVNHAPSSVIELHTLVEELGQRMNEDQINEIIQCVTTHLPIPDLSVDVGANVSRMDEDDVAPAIAHQPVEMDEAEVEAAQDAFPEEEFEHEQPGANMDNDGDDE